ncbi:MAG: dTDP-glucose pyrophosphorylase [Planctomycetes bacterium]|nr:dTDP-glucose pyrophosphorylase [Planctomycetota bacterium]
MTEFKLSKEKYKDVIGLLPMGGKASRIAPLPCSKELYPIGFRSQDNEHNIVPKVVCQYLIEKMLFAGISKTFVVLRSGKWDIPAYLGDGSMLNMDFAYLIMRLPFGVPYTIDQAYPFVKDNIIAFGFPDIIFEPEDAFIQLLKRQSDTDADIVLGVFPVDEPNKWDMVDLCDDGRIRQVLIKPLESNLNYNWIVAVWTPVFTHFMHIYLSTFQEVKKLENNENNISDYRELYIGSVIQSAIDNNLHVEGVIFPENACLDIGTQDDLVKAVRNIGAV